MYSLADKVAVAQLPSYPAQLGYVSGTYLGAWVMYTLWLRRQRDRWWPGQHPGRQALLIGALFIGSGYALVIGTMRVLPATYAVVLSNLGVVVAAFLSVFVFREREHAAQRLIWASLLAASLLWIAIQVQQLAGGDTGRIGRRAAAPTHSQPFHPRDRITDPWKPTPASPVYLNVSIAPPGAIPGPVASQGTAWKTSRPPRLPNSSCLARWVTSLGAWSGRRCSIYISTAS